MAFSLGDRREEATPATKPVITATFTEPDILLADSRRANNFLGMTRIAKSSAPVDEIRLETERLVLRKYRLSDFEDHFKLCADPDVMRYLVGGKPMSRLEAWRHMAFLVGHWELLGYGYFVAEEKASGRFVGRIGFANPEGWPGFEIGWTIAPEFQGRGFATEGGRFLLQYAFEEMDKSHVISVINPENKPSIRVAERLGEKLEGKSEVMGTLMLIYGIDRPER